MRGSASKLLAWYNHRRRDLPWRRTSDPYLIWASEIILQQTRVEQGLDYYLRFIRRFPDIRTLAEAEPDEVMKIWQGLGYYSRARNMQFAAKQVMEKFKGTFPGTYKDILSLKGIGPYTAAAIASICFGEPAPVVDGNVLRFLSRLHGITEPVDSAQGKRAIHELAARMMDPRSPGDFNQAMMEFGALYCTPAKPGCPQCIFRKECVAFNTGTVMQIPVKGRTAPVTNRFFHYLVVRYKKGSSAYIFLHRREANDIWKGLYEFPLIETAKAVSADKLMQSAGWKMIFRGTGPRFTGLGKTVKHRLSHRLIHARFYEVEVSMPLEGDYLLVSEEKLSNYPLPRLIEKYILSINHGDTETRF